MAIVTIASRASMKYRLPPTVAYREKASGYFTRLGFNSLYRLVQVHSAG